MQSFIKIRVCGLVEFPFVRAPGSAEFSHVRSSGITKQWRIHIWVIYKDENSIDFGDRVDQECWNKANINFTQIK